MRKKIGQAPPPLPSFGQNPKDQLHFFVKPSLTLKSLCIEIFVHQIQPSDISPRNFWSHLPFENGLFSLREAISWEIEDGRTIIFVKYLNSSLSGWTKILPDPSFENSKSKISQTQIYLIYMCLWNRTAAVKIRVNVLPIIRWECKMQLNLYFRKREMAKFPPTCR